MRKFKNGDRLFFTSDTHFRHGKIVQYTNRPFVNAREMDETMIDSWNSKVPKDGIVYHVGDFIFGSNTDAHKILDALNGEIHLVLGNHDNRMSGNVRKRFASVSNLTDIQVGDQCIVLCHYAMRVWNRYHYNAWHLYGHSHGGLPGVGKSMDVGVDTTLDWAPYSFDEIKSKLDAIERHTPEGF